MLPTPVFLGFAGGSDNKESACNAGDLGPIPGLGRSPGGWHDIILINSRRLCTVKKPVVTILMR